MPAKGSTFARTITFTGLPAGVALATSRIVFTLKHAQTDPDSAALALLDNTGLGGVVVTDTATAVATVPGTATYGLPDVPTFVLWYDVQVHDTLGRPWQSEYGQITITPRVLTAQP